MSNSAAGARKETSERRTVLRRMDAALRLVRSEVAPDITVHRLLILLAVRWNEGMSQKELLDTLDATSIPALSRNLADLSAFTSRKSEGPGLIELKTDPMNLRLRRVYLTKKGKRLMARVERALGAS